MAVKNRVPCNYEGCEKLSHASTGPCGMHYSRERRAFNARVREMSKGKHGGARDMRANAVDYEDFWLFVKKHVLWDGNGRPIGVKAGLNRDWRS